MYTNTFRKMRFNKRKSLSKEHNIISKLELLGAYTFLQSLITVTYTILGPSDIQIILNINNFPLSCWTQLQQSQPSTLFTSPFHITRCVLFDICFKILGSLFLKANILNVSVKYCRWNAALYAFYCTFLEMKHFMSIYLFTRWNLFEHK